MEFKGTIMFDVSPALLGAINRITDVFSATVVLNRPAPDFTGGGLVKGVSPVMGDIKETADTSQSKQPETVVMQADSALEPEKAPAVKYTKEQVKAAAAAKKEKRDDMKKILDEMGVKSIPALSENQYEEFMQKISVL